MHHWEKRGNTLPVWLSVRELSNRCLVTVHCQTLNELTGLFMGQDVHL